MHLALAGQELDDRIEDLTGQLELAIFDNMVSVSGLVEGEGQHGD